MTIVLPALVGDGRFTAAEIRLELACALYARGRLGRIEAAELAGVDIFRFQQALGDRRIPTCTADMLAGEVAALRKLFPA